MIPHRERSTRAVALLRGEVGVLQQERKIVHDDGTEAAVTAVSDLRQGLDYLFKRRDALDPCLGDGDPRTCREAFSAPLIERYRADSIPAAA